MFTFLIDWSALLDISINRQISREISHLLIFTILIYYSYYVLSAASFGIFCLTIFQSSSLAGLELYRRLGQIYCSLQNISFIYIPCLVCWKGFRMWRTLSNVFFLIIWLLIYSKIITKETYYFLLLNNCIMFVLPLVTHF